MQDAVIRKAALFGRKVQASQTQAKRTQKKNIHKRGNSVISKRKAARFGASWVPCQFVVGQAQTRSSIARKILRLATARAGGQTRKHCVTVTGPKAKQRHSKIHAARRT
jgi:hypothetical protein